MKQKKFLFALATSLMVAAGFTACTNLDNPIDEPVVPEPQPEPVFEPSADAVHYFNFSKDCEAYPYYRMGEPEGSSYDVKDNTLVITNEVEQKNMYDLQPFVLDWFNIKEGADYTVRITYKSTVAGSAWLAFGTWNASLPNYDVPIEATEDYTTVDIKFEKVNISTSGNDAHVLLQVGKLIGTIKVKMVELFESVPEPTFVEIEGGIGNLKVPGTYEKIGAWGGTWSGNQVENEKDWSAYEYVWIKYSGLSGNINFGVMYSEWIAHQSWGEQFKDATIALTGTEGIVGIKLDNTTTYVNGTAETDGQYKGDIYAKHIREVFIQATSDGASVTLEGMWVGSKADFEKASGADKLVWKNIMVNGDLEGDDLSGIVCREKGQGDVANVVAGVGVNGSKAAKINSIADAANGWDTQFFVYLPQALPAGTKYKIKFSVRSEANATISTQLHTTPGSYLGGAFGNFDSKPEWTVIEGEGAVEKDDTQSVAFNLNDNLTLATTFYFDNIEFYIAE